MHLEIEINKEIMDYQVQLASGLSTRKLLALIPAIIVTIILNMTLGQIVPQFFMMIPYAIVIFPFFVVGFLTYNSLPGEMAVLMLLNFIRTPKVLKVGCNNSFSNCIKADFKRTPEEMAKKGRRKDNE